MGGVPFASASGFPARQGRSYSGEVCRNAPIRATLLSWLVSRSYDASDEVVGRAEQYFPGFLAHDGIMTTFRDLRPMLYQAVKPFLQDGYEDVREAAAAAGGRHGRRYTGWPSWERNRARPAGRTHKEDFGRSNPSAPTGGSIQRPRSLAPNRQPGP